MIAYISEIVARTEQYFCPIKHARKVLGAHSRYSRFIEYGDAENYQERLEQYRRSLNEEKQNSSYEISNANQASNDK
jgi:hypothetical protein